MSQPNIEGTTNASTFGGNQMGYLDVQEFVPVAVANAGTVNLTGTQSLTVLRTTSDGTISGAVINLPTSPINGQVCKFSTTGIITTVTGTVSSAPVPVLAATAAGGVYAFGWNATLGLWFRV